MKEQTPAEGIMKMGEWRDARCFRVACDCGAREHDVDAWIEVDHEGNEPQISVTFYADLCVPFANFWHRVKIAWTVLTQGTYRQEHDLILRQPAARNFAAAIHTAISDMEPK